MIKNVYTYFFLASILIFFTPDTKPYEDSSNSETFIHNGNDDSAFYDQLDYYADHQPESTKHHAHNIELPHWIKRLYIAILVHLGKTNDYVTKKWNALKHSLAL